MSPHVKAATGADAHVIALGTRGWNEARVLLCSRMAYTEGAQRGFVSLPHVRLVDRGLLVLFITAVVCVLEPQLVARAVAGYDMLAAAV